MSIAGFKYARRRRVYQARPGSLHQELTGQGHHHGHRYRHKHQQEGLLQSRNNSFLEGSSVNDVGHKDYSRHAEGKTSSLAQNGVIAGNILQSERVLWSRSRPAIHRSASAWNDRIGAAIAARNRLDERLRAASTVNRRGGRTSFSANIQSDTSALWDGVETGIQNEGKNFEIDRRDWLAPWASNFHRSHQGTSTPNTHSLKPKEGLSEVAISDLKRELVVPSRRGTGKEFFGTTKRAGSAQQEDCPVCLERFTCGQTLIRLPCKHRFHADCLTPWLESHCHCPCCRFKVNDEMLLKTSPTTRSRNHKAKRPGDDLVSWMTAVETGLRRLGLQSFTF